MAHVKRLSAVRSTAFFCFFALCATGCISPSKSARVIPSNYVPTELDKVTMPEYRIEPPDILLIEAVTAVPKPPHKIEAFDVLFIQLANPIKDDPLTGLFSVEPDGTINLGASYGGSVKVAGLTMPQVREVIEQHLKKLLTEQPRVAVSLAQSRAAQKITGAHLVRSDGTISLGTYGDVRVVGLRLSEAKKAIESALAKTLQDPEVLVEIQGFNSKIYYVILDGGGSGQQVVRLPHTGNETVLDAISNVYGLSPVSSSHRIWVARPAPAASSPCQVLPVDWNAVSTLGDPTTNYQILPGDRVYVDAQPMVTLDTYLARLLAPVERVFGITLLGSSVNRSLSGANLNNGLGQQ